MTDPAIAAWSAAMMHAATEGAVLILLAWWIGRKVANVPPVVCCWMWRLVCARLLLVLIWPAPVIIPLLPGDPVRVSEAVAPISGPAVHGSTPADAASRVPTPQGPLTSLSPAVPSGTSGTLFVVWLLGAGACLCRVVVRWQGMRRLRSSCRPVDDLGLLQARSELARALGLRGDPSVVYSERIARPMVVGILQPEIILPRVLVEGAGAIGRRMILAHELAHLRRRDLLWSCLSTAVCVLCWFHPLVWLAATEARLAQELACDELTLRVTDYGAQEYGRLLLSISTADPTTRGVLAPSVGIADSYSVLHRRLAALELAQQPRTWTPLVMGIGLALAVSVGMVPWRAELGTRVSYLDLGSGANQLLDAELGEGTLAGNNLAELPRGEQVFAGHRFHIRELGIQLAASQVPSLPARVDGIRVGRRFSTLAILHGTAWGGQAPGKLRHVSDGTRIGEYSVHYADGTREVIPIVYGEDLRDWWSPSGIEEGPVTRGVVAWTAQNAATVRSGGAGIRLYVTRWKNPRPQHKVMHLDFSSTLSPAAPFCLALTCGE